MTQGRNFSGDRDDPRSLFDLDEERPGLIAEQTPPPGHPGPGSREPNSSHDRTEPVIITHLPTPASPAQARSGTGGSIGSFSSDEPWDLGFPLASDGSASFQPGQVLFDHYIVVRKLGEGGMGTVWLVRHMGFDAERALKLIVSGIARDPQSRARFRREARIMDRLNHPNAVRVYNTRMGKDFAFIEMEFIRGKSLNQLLVPGVAMPLDWVTDLLDQLCGVLQAAKDEGIIHRDLKPPNLMLVDGRQPGTKVLKLLDFGIAKIRESGPDDVRTQTGSFLGTPLYSSPEQIRGETVDARSDLYSVGVILFELLTGHRPFNGPINSIIYKHTAVAPPSFAEVNPRVCLPPMVEQVVMRCLAKDPGDRPQSPRELAALFHQAVAPAHPAGSSVFLRSKTWVADPGPGAPPGESEIQVRIPSWAGGSLKHPRGEDPTDLELVADPRVSPPTRRFSSWKTLLGSVPVLLAALILAVLSLPPFRDVGDLRIRKQIELWARQAFKVVEMAGKTDNWPNALIRTEDQALFRRTPGGNTPDGIYLPESYTSGVEFAEDGYPRTLTRKDDGTIFIRIVGGTFTMGGVDGAVDQFIGSAGPPSYPVSLSGFYMQQTEVTNGEIERHLAELGGPAACQEWLTRFNRLKVYLRGEDEHARRHPAGDISWRVAKLYAGKRGGRLPTEAQWEFAARSRGMNLLHVWDFREKDAVPLLNRANLNKYAETDEGTAEVRRYPEDVTVQGIFDLAGNVREWCRDLWKPSTASPQPVPAPAPAPAPASVPGPAPDRAAGAEDKRERVVRGGSFQTTSEFGETINRDEPHHPDDVTDDIGFRIVIECPEIRRAAR